jgi:hypothetical protein
VCSITIHEVTEYATKMNIIEKLSTKYLNNRYHLRIFQHFPHQMVI